MECDEDSMIDEGVMFFCLNFGGGFLLFWDVFYFFNIYIWGYGRCLKFILIIERRRRKCRSLLIVFFFCDIIFFFC